MSSFINKAMAKAEGLIDSKTNKGNNTSSDNYGSQSTSTGNRLDPTVDSDYNDRNPNSSVGGIGSTRANDTYGTTGGAGGFGSSDTYGSNTNTSGYDNPRSDNAGSYSSNLLNKADPRVDSDRDGRSNLTSSVGGIGNTQDYGDNYGQTGGAGGLASSDTGYGRGAGTYHDSTTHSTGYSGGNIGGGGYSDTSGTYGSTNQGTHNSSLANKLDPRVDSDNNNRNNPTSRVGGYGGQDDNYGNTTGGYGSQTTGYTSTDRTTTGVGGLGSDSDNYNTTSGGYGSTSGGYGGRDTTGGYDDSSYTAGSGNTSRTAGPHNSDLANKLDPRVDSDRDGSKTYGGDRTNY